MDARGLKRFERIDLKKFGNNQLLEDFLHDMDIEKSLDDVVKRLNQNVK